MSLRCPNHCACIDKRIRFGRCASALAPALVDRLAIDPVTTDELHRASRDEWGRIAVVPVETLCLKRASELARLHP
jgi:hypothetical protein